MSDRFDITLEHKLESRPGIDAGPGSEVRRLELISGTGRRRRWSSDDKARIVFESLEPGVSGAGPVAPLLICCGPAATLP